MITDRGITPLSYGDPRVKCGRSLRYAGDKDECAG